MDPELIPPLLAVGTALSLGGMALVGIRMWVNRVTKWDQNELADAVCERLRDDIHEEVARALEARELVLDDVLERLDFAERLLTRGRKPGRGDEGERVGKPDGEVASSE